MSRPPDHLSTVEDFLENEEFNRWVTERSPEDRAYWREWLTRNPEKREIYEQAVATLLVIQSKRIELSDEQVKNRVANIQKLLPNPFTLFRPQPIRQWVGWVAAATILFGIVWIQWGSPAPWELISQNTKGIIRPSGREWKLVKNISDVPMVVLLPENSSVLLSGNSQIRFCKGTNDTLREVYLQGEGFFEVAKNPAKPFMVYTTNLTTKVLGTSFQVRAFDNESTAYVKVKTGKVVVTPVKSPEEKTILVVNEQYSLEGKSIKIEKKENLPLNTNSTDIIVRQFNFEFTPVNELFSQLESVYHMPIVYDPEVLRNCTFTGQLNDVPFLEKIRLVCQTIESTFEVVDNQIIINSRGCN